MDGWMDFVSKEAWNNGLAGVLRAHFCYCCFCYISLSFGSGRGISWTVINERLIGVLGKAMIGVFFLVD